MRARVTRCRQRQSLTSSSIEYNNKTTEGLPRCPSPSPPRFEQTGNQDNAPSTPVNDRITPLVLQNPLSNLSQARATSVRLARPLISLGCIFRRASESRGPPIFFFLRIDQKSSIRAVQQINATKSVLNTIFTTQPRRKDQVACRIDVWWRRARRFWILDAETSAFYGVCWEKRGWRGPRQ